MPIVLRLAVASVAASGSSIAHGQLTIATSSALSGSEKVLLLTIDPRFHYRLYPHLTISHSPSLNTYTLPPSPPTHPAPLTLTLPFPSSQQDEEDSATFHSLLSSYLTLIDQTQEGLKGKVVLIDEDTGKVVGEMDVDSEGGINADHLEGGNGPVVVDLNQASTQGGVRVTEVPANEMDDVILRGASSLSKNLLSGASFLSNKMQAASSAYIQRATPRAEPVVVSDSTKKQLERVNGVTLAGKQTVKKATGFLSRNIQLGVEYTINKGSDGVTLAQSEYSKRYSPSQSQVDLSSFPNSKTLPPPIPPKPDGMAAQKAKRPLLSRFLLAGDVILTSLESSTATVLGSASVNSTAAITHKFGSEAGEASRLAGGSVLNVSAAFIDAKGVGRRALIKGAGKGFVKTKMRNEKDKVYGSLDVESKIEEDQAERENLVEGLNTANPPPEYPRSESPVSYTNGTYSPPRSNAYSTLTGAYHLPPPSRQPPLPTLPPQPLGKPKAFSTGWTRPSAPSAESFNGITDGVDKLTVSPAGAAKEGIAQRRLPPALPAKR